MGKGSTYVISDIHGCYDQFMELLERVSFCDDDRLYIIGDAIDRGPKSGMMIDWLANRKPDNVTFMMGNHEYMMLDDMRGAETVTVDEFFPSFHGDWVYNGGYDTCEQAAECCDDDTIDRFVRLCRNAPFTQTVRFEDANGRHRKTVLVHAGFVEPTRDGRNRTTESVSAMLSRQSPFSEVWIREPWLFGTWIPPVDVVFGHTPTTLVAPLVTDLMQSQTVMSNGNVAFPNSAQMRRGNDARIMQWNGRIDIDCGCVYGGRLACLRLEDGNVWYADGYDRQADTQRNDREKADGYGWH